MAAPVFREDGNNLILEHIARGLWSDDPSLFNNWPEDGLEKIYGLAYKFCELHGLDKSYVSVYRFGVGAHMKTPVVVVILGRRRGQDPQDEKSLEELRAAIYQLLSSTSTGKKTRCTMKRTRPKTDCFLVKAFKGCFNRR
ncbi:hypothetical protein MMC10_002728 [Thelotrema lepadinum]|nr:hypothetical protein [Thelotrema lepadinum]